MTDYPCQRCGQYSGCQCWPAKPSPDAKSTKCTGTISQVKTYPVPLTADQVRMIDPLRPQPERIVEEKWVYASARAMDHRLDALRQRADFLARKIHLGQLAPGGRYEKEYAALMWAIAELSGVGDKVRRQALERAEMKIGVRRDSSKRAEHAEALNAQYRVTIAALKADIHRLRTEVSR